MSQIEIEKFCIENVKVKTEPDPDPTEQESHFEIHEDQQLVDARKIKKEIKVEASEDHVKIEILSDEEDIAVCNNNSNGSNTKQVILNSFVHSNAKVKAILMSTEKCLCPFHLEDQTILNPYNNSETYKCTLKNSEVCILKPPDQLKTYTIKKKIVPKPTTESKLERSMPIYKCPSCVFRTINKEAMKEHYQGLHDIRCHTSTKKYSCNNCQYKTALKTLLLKHIKRRHDRQVIFTCDLCKFHTTRESAMTTHKQIHEMAAKKTDYKMMDFF